MAYNEPNQSKLVGYAPDAQSSYNTQTGVKIKPDAYYDMMLLKMLRQMEFHYSKYAIQKSLPRNYGDTINWRRFKKLEVASNLGALTEGVTPAGKEGISGEQITAVIAQYGEVMYFTDLVDLQQLDDVRREYTIELGYIAQETLDLIVRNTLVNEGSVYFAGGATTLAALTGSAHRPSIDDFRKILLGFKKDYVSGIRGASGRYVALISPEVMYALFDDKRMLQYMSFGQTNAPLSDGVAIDMFGIRFEEVLNAPVVGSAHDSIVLADEAYAITKLQGEGNVRVITKGLGSAGVSDPLDQRQSIGYKITGFSAKVLRPESVVNYWSNPSVAGAAVNTVGYEPEAAGRLALQENTPPSGGNVPQILVEWALTSDSAGVTITNTSHIAARSSAVSVFVSDAAFVFASDSNGDATHQLENYYLDKAATKPIAATAVASAAVKLEDIAPGNENKIKLYIKGESIS
jgi:N4-gp56 family major capsid protein